MKNNQNHQVHEGNHIPLSKEHPFTRPMYFVEYQNKLIFSESFQALYHDPRVDRTIDDWAVADFLVNGHFRKTDRTLFKQIRKVPFGHSATLKNGQVDFGEHFIDSIQGELYYKNERDYVEHLQELLERVIARAISGAHKVAAHSSGGLDSTPIAIIASKMVDYPLTTYNWCKPDEGDPEDWHEWHRARQVAKEYQFDHHEIGIDAPRILQLFEEHNPATDGIAMALYEKTTLQMAKTQGVTHILSGFGGDELLTMRGRNDLTDLFASFQWKEVVKQLKMQSLPNESLQSLRLAKRFARVGVHSVLPKAMRFKKAYQSHAERFATKRDLFSEPYRNQLTQNKNYLEMIALSSIHEKQRHQLKSGYHQERIESWKIMGDAHGVEYCYPFLDKEVIEFALKLPESFYFKYGKPRYLYTQAIQGMMSDKAYSELSGGKQPESYRVNQMLEASHQAIETRLKHKHQAGYLDAKTLQQLKLSNLDQPVNSLLRNFFMLKVTNDH